MTLEEKLHEYILSKYSSVLSFCTESGIASSTVFTMFKRGIKKSTSTTVLRVCKELKIDAQSLYDGIIQPLDDEIESSSTDIIQFLCTIGSQEFSYHGKILTRKQKEMILYASKIAVQLASKEIK